MSSAQRKQSWACVCYPEVLTMPGETQGSETQERFAVGRYKAGKEALTGLPAKADLILMSKCIPQSEHTWEHRNKARGRKIPGASTLL